MMRSRDANEEKDEEADIIAGMGRLKARIRMLTGLIKDKAALAVSSGSPLRDAVVRATTHKESPPKDALVAFIVESSSGASASASGRLVGELMRRLSATHTWVVALKSLIVLHRLCRDGAGAVRDHITDADATVHEYLRAALHGFADRHGGRLPLTWHVQRYARYLHTRLTLWKTGGRVGDEEIASEMEAMAEVLADAREALAAAAAAAEVAPGARARAVVLESARLVVADWWRAQERMRARAEELRRRLWNMAVRPPSARLLLEAAEKAAAGEDRFADELTASPLRPVLGGRGTMLLSRDLRELLARVIDALRAVCGVRAFSSSSGPGPAAAAARLRPLLLLSHREYALPAPPPAVKRAVTLV